MNPVERLDPFDADRFLEEFWQRRPCLIGNWIQAAPLPLDDLLDAADSLSLPARLIRGRQDLADWTLLHGPLEADDLPDTPSDWTVLVQEMDKARPEVESVLDRFREFLPDWLLDDVMISQAAPGGSVGAHADAYDVFLVQVGGTRLWQLAENFDTTLDNRFELALLARWQPETEVRAEPGDTLYLPASIAHHGVAQNTCQTWSVGLRTPSGPEMLFLLGELLTAQSRNPARLSVQQPERDNPARIGSGLVTEARRLLEHTLSMPDAELEALLGRILTQWRLWPRDEEPELETIVQHLGRNRSLKLHGSARLAIHGRHGEAHLTINGEPIRCPSPLARELAQTRLVGSAWLECRDGLEQLCDLGAIDIP
ncbi:cupin domain-containing protein [Wenzhouxiangella sp. AB-CW3]|uniref:cupin domain-containing protein n=1 Tax=Wenzhouxiangella sp. AB-CW3 TaxID=2771012 RepID=UPI00168BFBD5|nr:cupin domain-containing protein [Wenzhouxiangella sp. AB-CW3]QOC21155.1 cupin domain-containing protein [Wenzhouxiangella sp. AB-CW3]